MVVKTQFDVNNLVRHKFENRGEKQFIGLEIMEIITQTFYGGTQTFYLCRPIICQKEFKEKWRENGEFEWSVTNGIAKQDGYNNIGWERLTEDELVSLEQNKIDIILGK